MTEMIDRAFDLTHLNRAALVAFFAFMFFFFGCGDGKQLPDQASSTLGPRVEAIRAAAVAGDRTGAQAGVDQLRADLSALRGANVIGEEDAARVLDAVDEVEARLALLPAPTTTTTATTAPPPAPQDTGEERKPKGHKHDD